jgi:type IV fimbrial biogenesis protein FimT
MTRPHPQAAGFTLIELMVTISVLSILLAIAVPNFTTFIRNNRLATQTNAVIGALNYARAEASTRGQSVSVCAANQARNACDNANNWMNGWIIFTDRTGTVGQLDGTDRVLQAGGLPTDGFVIGATGPFVRFGIGQPSTAQTFTVSPTLASICMTTGARRIDVAATGRVQASKVSC